MPSRRDYAITDALTMVAPGQPLREGLDRFPNVRQRFGTGLIALEQEAGRVCAQVQADGGALALVQVGATEALPMVFELVRARRGHTASRRPGQPRHREPRGRSGGDDETAERATMRRHPASPMTVPSDLPIKLFAGRSRHVPAAWRAREVCARPFPSGSDPGPTDIQTKFRFTMSRL
mgnify:CR=1 FL=1